MDFIEFAWLACGTYAVASIVGKLATKHHIANPWLYNFVWFCLTAVLTVPLALYYHVGMPRDWNSILWLSLANAVSGTAFILAFYAIDISVLGPLFNLRTPILVLVGALIYKEVLTPLQWILMAILLIASIAVNAEERFKTRGLLGKRIALIIFTIGTSAWFNGLIKVTAMRNGYWETLLWPNIIGTMLIIPTIPLFYRDMRKLKLSRYWGLVLSSLLFTVGYFFEVKAVSRNVSLSMAIISLPLSMVIAIAFSVFAPKLLEKHTVKIYAIRLTAAAIMFAAAMGLSR